MPVLVGAALLEGSGSEGVAFVLDLSEQKRAEEALRASEQVARGQAEALVQSLDTLATAPASDQFILRMLSTHGPLVRQSVGCGLVVVGRRGD